MIKVGINGFGRIGKMLTKILLQDTNIDLITINDLADIETQAHLFKYDSIHGKFKGSLQVDGQQLKIDRFNINYSSEPNPADIQWDNVDIVIEATGKFTTRIDASHHLRNEANKVIISAPSSSTDVKSILVGINEEILADSDRIVSNASCTTNCAGPLIKILDDHCGIESAYITTVHSYTGDQRLHDAPHKDLRRARAGALSIIPTSTGAAKAMTKIFTHLDGKIGGCGIRVPVANGSLTDISCIVKNPLTIDDLNATFHDYASNKMTGILEYNDEPIVSRDIIGNSHSCIFDAPLTSVIGNMVKVVGWYDNESGYSHRLHDLIRLL